MEGYGEGVPRTYVTGESVQTALDTLRGPILRAAGSERFGTLGDVEEYLLDLSRSPLCQRHLAAFCAFELALLDLSSRTWDSPLETIFGTRWTEPPPYSAVIPLLPPDRMLPFLGLLENNGMKRIKIKVGEPFDPRVFERVISVLGSDVDLRVDANGAWTETAALKHIEIMEEYGISAVEQPVAKDNIRGLREITSRSPIPIIADESVCSLEDAAKLIDLGACHALNVRLSKCGGFFGSLAIAEMAARAGLRRQIGCQVGETGILSAAGRHLAGWIEDLLYLEGSFGTWALQEDIVEEDIRFGKGGKAYPFDGIGLGIHVRPEALEERAIASERFVF